MTSLTKLISLNRLSKLGIVDGVTMTDAFMSHTQHYFKQTCLESITSAAQEYGIKDTEKQVSASLILSFCHWSFPREWDLEEMATTLTKLRDNTIEMVDFENMIKGMPTREEFKKIDAAVLDINQPDSR